MSGGRWKNSKVRVMLVQARIYTVYLAIILVVVILLGVMQVSLSNIDAAFEAPEDRVSGSTGGIGSEVTYNYFLDLSPSMQGFLYEEQAGVMCKVADAFEHINSEGQGKMFYWCRDTIVSVGEASDFYASMQSANILTNYYEDIIINSTIPIEEEEQEPDQGPDMNIQAGEDDIARTIEAIDLSKLFTVGYGGTSDSLQVIITDLNFFQDADDLEMHNVKLERFASGLGQAAAKANFCLYAIDSNYVGTGNDAYSSATRNNTTATIYVIIYSENDRAYTSYCNRFESEMTSQYIQRKFELRNHLGEQAGGLKVDIDRFKSMDLVDKENLNYADGVFDNLTTNAFALQLVRGESGNAVWKGPMAVMNLPGYYQADTLGVDDSKVNMVIDLWQPHFGHFFQKDNYERYKEEAEFAESNAAIYYNTEGRQWYLWVNMEFQDTHLDVPEADSWYQKLMGYIRKKYVVMELKFYMAEPSYSKPEWIPAARYPHREDMETQEVKNVEIVVDMVIQNKEQAYTSLSREERYLGEIVCYVLY